MAAELASKWLLLDPQIVRQALARLFKTKVHPHFAGYLCVLHQARASGKQTDLHPDFKDFFERFLKVDGATSQKPYVQPFTDLKKGNRWSPFFNANPAGSYAPSSLREEVAPFLRVVTIKGNGPRASYSLDPSHAAKAFDDLLLKKKLPVASLAIFLYRDYGFKPTSRNVAIVLDTFREEFGFRDSSAAEQAAFDRLFHDDSSELGQTDIFGQAVAESGGDHA